MPGLQRGLAAAAGRPVSDRHYRPWDSMAKPLGQHEAPIGTGRLLSCYSSSVAMDLTARVLAERVRRVALIHPTFDNNPDLLTARGLELVPVAEAALQRRAPHLPVDVGARSGA